MRAGWRRSVIHESGSETAGDRALVERFLAQRDDASFRPLYRAHTPALVALARRLAGDVADAEDAVQETWIRAVRRLPGFRWESSLRTWLAGITVNCCREVVRRRGPLAAAAAPEPTAAPPNGTRELASLLAALPDGYREVLVLHDVEGYTHEEIGRLLEIHSGTSKSQLSRARRTLRAWLDGAEK